ncbi:unnamed protein product [Discosporangium mesarthrocarpum]
MSSPYFRVPAAWLSPAALFILGGSYYYYSRDWKSPEEVAQIIDKEFPHTARRSGEQKAQMAEFFRKVRSNDAREEERMHNLLNAGVRTKMKRHSPTSKEIEEFGPIITLPASQAVAPSEEQGKAATSEEGRKAGALRDEASTETSSGGGSGGEGGGDAPRRRWWKVW